ncbi:MAG: hypothetical protein DMG68_16395, partial [Acidobacteria bacterium]
MSPYQSDSMGTSAVLLEIGDGHGCSARHHRWLFVSGGSFWERDVQPAWAATSLNAFSESSARSRSFCSEAFKVITFSV